MGITLWMSGEIQADVADQYRLARKDVEEAINEVISVSEYGDGVREWSFIGILREQDHPDFDEITKYEKKTRDFEFRLKIDHATFKQANPTNQRKVIVEAVLRSISEMRKHKVQLIDYDRLESDVKQVAQAKGWL